MVNKISSDIIALDLGTNTGWFNGVIGGTFKPDGRDQLFNNFKKEIGILLMNNFSKNTGAPTIIYEEAAWQKGAASYIYNGQKAILEMLCQDWDTEMTGYSPMTVKKIFTGSGKASKEDIIKECKDRGFNPVDDNHADAIATYYTHLHRIGN